MIAADADAAIVAAIGRRELQAFPAFQLVAVGNREVDRSAYRRLGIGRASPDSHRAFAVDAGSCHRSCDRGGVRSAASSASSNAVLRAVPIVFW